jgi:putative ATP-dependent endonuclease of OLD family
MTKVIDFDAMGISVCSIAGTNFAPYVKLLGPKGLDLPFVVLTDYDPKREEVEPGGRRPCSDAGVTDSYGESRVVNQIMQHVVLPKALWKEKSFEEVLEASPQVRRLSQRLHLRGRPLQGRLGRTNSRGPSRR